MRVLFIFLRAGGYGMVGYELVSYGHFPWWKWVFALLITLWSVWDHWKRPDDLRDVMIRGIVMEIVLIGGWCVLMSSGTPAVLLLSPLVRACVHLFLRKTLSVFVGCLLVLGVVEGVYPLEPKWAIWAIFGVMIGFGTYGLIIGEMLRQREKFRRLSVIAAFERELQIKNAERVRMAGQLHDVMGQYWTAVVRSLDVATSVQGEQHQQFLEKAREAALEGLRVMRSSVHEWYVGRKTPAQWMEEVDAAIHRFQDWGGVKIKFHFEEVDWRGCFEDEELVAEAVARIILEALTNAVRHSAASFIKVGLGMRHGLLVVQVEDDGIGMPDTNLKEGMGHSTMRKLASEANGSIEWTSRGERGTRVVLRIPSRLFSESEVSVTGGE